MTAHPIRRARSDRRALVVVAVAAALVLPAAPAGADPHSPSKQELRRAQQHVASARRLVESLQAQAERAAEEYNGALVRAHKAQAARAEAAQHAGAAEATYATVRTQADAAQAAAQQATAQADAARTVQRAAQAEADEAQRVLNRMAISAWQGDGNLGMVSQLLAAQNPIELANGRTLINHVGAYQDSVIERAVRARAAAQAATDRAEAAESKAAGAWQTAATALEKATTARDAAAASQHAAARAASAAVAAADDAARAKRTALRLVAQAEAQLSRAVRSASSLQAQADAARRAAAGLDDGTAPSDAARTAIHWAFEEIGVPYAWGGGDENGPTEGFAQGAGTVGFDCSGLTLFIYHKAGIHLDHYTGSQWQVGKRVWNRSDLLPGDLMFFAYDTSDERTIHHVAIYIGKGKMIEAPYTGEVVRVTSANRPDFIGATRPWV